jgi:hypothetical protein
MARVKATRAVFVFVATVIGLATASATARTEQETPLSEAGERLLTIYSGMLEALQAQIFHAVPNTDEKKRDAFMQAHAAESEAEPYQDTNPAFAQAEAKSLHAAQPILADVEAFLGNDTLDARLVKCAVLANAIPRRMAAFAQQGEEEAAIIEKLLNDEGLMKQMLVAGGAKDGRYARAIQIYSAIQKASRHVGKGILHRLALGTSLEHAVPIEASYGGTTLNVDPVKRYLDYERAYLSGELDPAFPGVTTWECRHITNDPFTDEELAWGREMIRNYRPDIIFEPDYRWRYAKIVKTDVAYKTPEWTPELGTSKAQQLINGGGKCGPRAWFGRFATRCFGIPTWGVRQRGHAAMSHWTPNGWTTCFGAHWRWNWWDGRRGLDFLLETQAREHPKDYMKVLRAQWIGDALGEKKVDGMRPGTGGFWHALALNQKRAIVAQAKPIEVEPTGADLAEANESTEAEKIMKTEIKETDKKIVTGRDGKITIPAVACSTPRNNTAKILFMKSFSGGMQMHYNRLGNQEAFEYVFEVAKPGKYAISGRVVTVNRDQHLLMTPNNAGSAIDIVLPYTVGMWGQTKPVEITLLQGTNTLSFTRQAPNYGLTIKDFTLTPLK